MGLPIFIAPVEPDVAAKATEKVASGLRSSIRRQRTVRGPQARLSAENRRRRMLGMVGDINGDNYEVWENAHRSPPEVADATPVASIQAAQAHRMFERERMRLRDNLSFERRYPPVTEVDAPLMPPVPESTEFNDTISDQEQIRLRHFAERRIERERSHDARRDLRRIARRRPAPTPPYSEREVSLRESSNSPRLSPTPPLSVSRQPRAEGADRSLSPSRISVEEFQFTTRAPPFVSDRARSAISERVAALNRASNNMARSSRLMRQARLDGLGDRDRSLSPEGGAAWDTLLGSITPDPQPPSAGSSFASASAAAAASSSNSGPASTNTSLTTSQNRTDSPILPDCVSESGSNTDDDDEDIFELRNFNGVRRARLWGSGFGGLDGPSDPDRRRAPETSGTPSDTEHLGGMHRIISRLAERDDIPDEWWLGAGLRREPPT